MLFDEAIIRHVKRIHNVLIGERTAEEIKINVATVHPEGRQVEQEVRGRDLVTGLRLLSKSRLRMVVRL
mgnify:CR=1 FL=1